MATTPKRRYWDACAWIALISDEKIRAVPSDPQSGIIEDRGQMCRQVIHAAEKDLVEIVTSAFSLAEVCKSHNVNSEVEDNVKYFFEHRYILVVNLDFRVGSIARKLMMENHAGLKPADATHLASAIISCANEFHTFDKKLIGLDGKIIDLSGMPIKICKPSIPGPSAPLFDKRTNSEPKQIELRG